MATAAAGELQWRRGGTEAVRLSRSSSVRFTRPRLAEAPLEPAPFSGEQDALPVAAESRGDQDRSLVIHRDHPGDSMRAAQLPDSGSATDPAGRTDRMTDGSAPADALQSPLGPTPNELPPFESPQPEGLPFESPAMPQNGGLQLEPTQPPPLDAQPFAPPGEFQPAPLDTTMPPGPLPEDVPAPSIGTMEAERLKAEQACEQGLLDLQAKTIDSLELSIAVTGTEGSDYPFECALEDQWHEGRFWEQTVYLWKASALCHKPLYFEDEQLERYGHSWPPCCQPFVSGAHFFTRLPVLPYCMGVEPPTECVYALGHYRPGSCAPYMCNAVPLSVRGGLIQAGAVVGTAAVLP